jgi:hypothetical protein
MDCHILKPGYDLSFMQNSQICAVPPSTYNSMADATVTSGYDCHLSFQLSHDVSDSSGVSFSMNGFIERFELHERTRATHVPDQINVRNPQKCEDQESHMSRLDFGRVVTTIS